MKVVYVSTLKARFSEFLRLVKSGEAILVTERGRPVALLSPVTQASSAVPDPRMATLTEQGLIRPPQGPLPEDFVDQARPADPAGRLLAALLQERAEGP